MAASPHWSGALRDDRGAGRDDNKIYFFVSGGDFGVLRSGERSELTI